MQNYPKELAEGISPLIFAVNGADGKEASNNQSAAEVLKTPSPSSFDKLVQHMTLTNKAKRGGFIVPADENVGDGNQSSSNSSENSTTATSFFSRARFVTVSKTHAFPPSADPVGNTNRTSRISSVLGLRAQTSLLRGPHMLPSQSAPPSPNKVQYSSSTISDSAIVSYLKRNPIEGILPEGWIEKHAHALPSVVVLVVHLDMLYWNKQTNNNNATIKTTQHAAYYHQAMVEKHLAELCDQIRSSLAEKRACPIHLVCIVPIEASPSYGPWNSSSKLGNTPIPITSSPAFVTMENEKINSLRTVCKLPTGAVSILHYHENTTPVSNATSPFQLSELLKLETALQEASLSYYRNQIKRIKDKLNYLQISSHPELLTAAARYSFKLALFIEIEDRVRGSSNCVNHINTIGNHGPFGGPLFPKTRGKDTSSSQGENGGLKYWYDAYDFNVRYYRYLVGGTVGVQENEHLMDEPEDKEKTLALNESKRDGTDDTKLVHTQTETLEKGTVNGEQVTMLSYQQDLSPETDDIEQGRTNNDANVTVNTPTLIAYTTSHTAIHSDDMPYQCRGFADWVNYKILSKLSGLLMNLDSTMKTSPVENPLVEAEVHNVNNRRSDLLNSIAKQIQRHCGIFVTIEQRLSQDGSGYLSNVTNHMQEPLWYRLLYSYQQRLFIAQLLEHVIHPLYLRLKSDSSGLLASSDVWDILCSSALYASVGDIILRLDSVIRSEIPLLQKSKTLAYDENRRKFVGSSNLYAFKKHLREASQQNHRDIALDCMRRAVALREEMNKVSNKGKDVISAKYRYVIGLLLMKDKKYEDAIPFFQASLDRSHNFPRAHLAISKALAECVISTSNGYDSKPSDCCLPIVLDSQTSNMMASSDLIKMITAAFNLDPHVPDTKSIDIIYSGENPLPISYFVTFPETVCAVQGEEVTALVMLCSNLPFELQLSEIHLSTNLGTTHQINFQSYSSLPVLSQKQIKYFRTTSIPVPNTELLTTSSDVGHKTIRSNTYGLSTISASVKDKVTFIPLSSGMSSLRLSSLSLTLSMNDIRSRHVILHFNPKKSKYLTEDDMYISTSWSRPGIFPMRHGPSHLCIARPKAMIDFFNLTVKFNKGKVLEGTVNRIIFAVRPGYKEMCRNMEFNVVCYSNLGHDRYSGASSSLLDQEETQDNDDIDRSPVLVKVGATCDNLPSGWALDGENGHGKRDDWRPLSELVNDGSVAYIPIDLFRPLPSLVDPEYARDQTPCRTDIIVSFRYIQISSDRNDTGGALVKKEFHETVYWCSPLHSSLSIITDSIKSLSSGQYHHLSPHGSSLVRSGDVVPVRCTVRAAHADDGLNIRLMGTSFLSTFDGQDESCLIELIGNTSNGGKNVIFEPKQDDVNSLLKSGTKINLLYTVRPSLKVPGVSVTPIFTRLGSLHLYWRPIPFPCPEGVEIQDAFKGFHGPLPLSDIGPVVFSGPQCYLEETPFAISVTSTIDLPRVFIPFDVTYHLENKVDAHQRIRIKFISSENHTNESIVLSGISCSEIHLGPMEKKIVPYSMLAVKAGRTIVPSMSVTSDICQSWIVHGGHDTIILP